MFFVPAVKRTGFHLGINDRVQNLGVRRRGGAGGELPPGGLQSIVRLEKAHFVHGLRGHYVSGKQAIDRSYVFE